MNVVSRVVNWYYSFFYFKHLWIDALAINYFCVWFIVWTQQFSYLLNVSYISSIKIVIIHSFTIIYDICKCMYAKLAQKLQNHRCDMKCFDFTLLTSFWVFAFSTLMFSLNLICPILYTNGGWSRWCWVRDLQVTTHKSKSIFRTFEICLWF
jgi:hypothetical protein